MAFVQTNLPCPNCNSSDAYGIDDKGWGKCFSCYENVHPSKTGVEAADEDSVITNRVVPLPIRKQHTEPVRSLQMDKLIHKAIIDRKISLNTAERYGVGYIDSDLYFPYGDKAAKVRKNGEKHFTIKGDWTASKKLFGQEHFSAGGKLVIITEGEFDALSAYQMMESRYAVVSVRNGAQSALKDCKENYEFLDSFDSIYVAFDMDDAGRKASKQVAELFAKKSKIVKLPNGYKDANDMLMDGKQKEFSICVWRGESYVPDGIVAGDSLLEEVMKPIKASDVMYPFAGLNELTYGIRLGEMVTVTAGSGLGKSQFIRELVWQILQTTEERVGLMFMEESVRKTALSLMSLAANKPLHLPDCNATDEEKVKAFEQTLGTGKVYLFDHFGSSDVDNIVNRVRYMAKAMDCRYVFLDHVSIIVSAQSNGDERKAIDEIMTKLRTLVQETGIALIVVSHLKRPESKGHEEGAATSLAQLRGSASIAQLSDMVLGLERNGQADDAIERNTTHVRVLKNRFCGITGKACQLLYSHETGRMTETYPEEVL